MFIPKVFDPAIEPLSPDFEALFREHYQLVYRTAYGITGSTQDAEDVLQTVFLKLLRRATSPDLRGNPKGYLYRAAVNLSLDILERRRKHVLVDDAATFDRPIEPVHAGRNDKTRQWVSDALAQLNFRSVEMLILRYEHDYTDAEIARILGTSRGVVAVTLFRARARLKKLLSASRENES
jgi:RNA polymerase sigma-70 factor (ECF subfamily)